MRFIKLKNLYCKTGSYLENTNGFLRNFPAEQVTLLSACTHVLLEISRLTGLSTLSLNTWALIVKSLLTFILDSLSKTVLWECISLLNICFTTNFLFLRFLKFNFKKRWLNLFFSCSQLSEEVQRKQSEYQKCLESYKQMRAKFEENYLKCKIPTYIFNFENSFSNVSVINMRCKSSRIHVRELIIIWRKLNLQVWV